MHVNVGVISHYVYNTTSRLRGTHKCKDLLCCSVVKDKLQLYAIHQCYFRSLTCIRYRSACHFSSLLSSLGVVFLMWIFVNCICLACIVVILRVFVVSYVYLLYYVCIAVSYFRCRTAGYKSVSGRSCDRPPRHRFFLVSLCLQANSEMVPKFPSCYYMLLM